jgi:hypothetical protein
MKSTELVVKAGQLAMAISYFSSARFIFGDIQISFLGCKRQLFSFPESSGPIRIAVGSYILGVSVISAS